MADTKIAAQRRHHLRTASVFKRCKDKIYFLGNQTFLIFLA
jgi:hypothetical protein